VWFIRSTDNHSPFGLLPVPGRPLVNSSLHTAVPEQAIEGVFIHKVKRSNHEISRQMCAILADADAFHSGGARGFDTVLGVFHNDAMLGRATQSCSRDQEHIGVRLTPAYILSGRNGFEAFPRV
jgi:hypothetical protein